MKNLFTILTAIFLTISIFLPRQASAQSPEKMNYQAVIRDSNGHVITNQAIGMQISILQGSASTGTAVYTETQLITSNANGLIKTEIGTGTVVIGIFSIIDWANGPFFLQIETDPTGGTNYIVTGTNQLLSVPYAMHAKTADSLTDIDSFSWSTTGNTGTDPATNFIGTIDDQPLILKVNNVQAGKISSDYNDNTFYGFESGLIATGVHNAAVGYQTLHSNTIGSYNTALGHMALTKNTTGSSNTAIGQFALYDNITGIENTAIGRVALFHNVSGSQNTAIGRAALDHNSSGSGNTAIGFDALIYNHTGMLNTAIGKEALYNSDEGNHNTAIGNKALYDNDTGHWNTATGSAALQNNNSGDNNTAVGFTALYSNTSGYENTAIGKQSLYNTTTAGRNVGVGYQAGFNNSTGFYNTAVGYKAGPATSNIKNSTAIGRGASTTAWNQIRIGNDIVTSIGGYVSWSNISDKRFKKKIQQDIVGLDFIMALEPVSYQLDMDKLEQSTGNTRHASDSSHTETEEEREFNLQSKLEKGFIRQSGFLAQDVEQAAISVGYDFSGVDKPKNEDDFYGLRYAEFVVPLVKGMQEQQQLIEELTNENKQIKDELAQIKLLLNKNTQK